MMAEKIHIASNQYYEHCDDDDIDDETKSSNSMYFMSERMRLMYNIAIELELETPRLSHYYFSLYGEFLLSDARLNQRSRFR